jgi:predicted amidophosphoribosyltransferase
MFCPSCGAENPDNKNFCGKCRRPLNVVARVSRDFGQRLARLLRWR